MADEAVLRIIMQDGGGASQSSQPSTVTSPQPTKSSSVIPTSSSSTIPTATKANTTAATIDFDPNNEDYIAELAQKRIDREKFNAKIDLKYQELRQFDPLPFVSPPSREELVKKRIEREEEETKLDALYQKMKSSKPPITDTDRKAIVQKRLEREDEEAKLDELRKKMRPPVVEVFDPVAAAEKRIKRENEQAAADAIYAKIKPPVVETFNPVKEANKRYENKKKADQIDEAYNKLYGEAKQGGKYDSILKTAESFRGTIGGIFGTLAGTLLDAIASYRKIDVSTKGANKPTIGTGVKLPTVKGGAAKAEAGVEGAATAEAGGAGAAGAEVALGAAAASVAVFAVAIIAAVKAVEALIDFINKAEQKYGNYNAQIAQAQAIAEVRTVLGDVKRSQMVGESMAKYIQSRTDVEQKYEDIKVKLLEKILPTVTAILDGINSVMSVVDTTLEVLGAANKITSALGDITKLMPKTENKNAIPDDPTSVLFKDEDKGGVQSPVTPDGKWWL